MQSVIKRKSVHLVAAALLTMWQAGMALFFMIVGIESLVSAIENIEPSIWTKIGVSFMLFWWTVTAIVLWFLPVFLTMRPVRRWIGRQLRACLNATEED